MRSEMPSEKQYNPKKDCGNDCLNLIWKYVKSLMILLFLQ